MANHIMIDIESLDTSPYCVILTIGAVRFDPRGDGIVEKLELRPTLEDQTEIYNRIINDDTIRWWSTQNSAALEEAMGDNDREPLKDCMEKLYKFCWNRQAVWSHGAPFDVVVMETAMRQTTLFEIAGVSLKDKKYSTKTTHKAVEDAAHQAIVVQDAYKKLMDKGFALK